MIFSWFSQRENKILQNALESLSGSTNKVTRPVVVREPVPTRLPYTKMMFKGPFRYDVESHGHGAEMTAVPLERPTSSTWNRSRWLHQTHKPGRNGLLRRQVNTTRQMQLHILPSSTMIESGRQKHSQPWRQLKKICGVINGPNIHQSPDLASLWASAVTNLKGPFKLCSCCTKPSQAKVLLRPAEWRLEGVVVE
ncbi:Anaphase-promoting complex subunit 8 [Fusarium oxysporum f. sp. albedinis]|nr:Anaphase-promoting complex subunit 8 [Fusarium oxysporum f. sp. albedinis]